MIEVGSSLVLVFENRQLYQFFPFIFIIIIVSHVKYAHWIKDLWKEIMYAYIKLPWGTL